MFLLILDALKAQSKTEIAFTFHNVSINSNEAKKYVINLLKFTFHNVSINSFITVHMFSQIYHLHSTMFLLIPLKQRRFHLCL